MLSVLFSIAVERLVISHKWLYFILWDKDFLIWSTFRFILQIKAVVKIMTYIKNAKYYADGGQLKIKVV